MSVSFLPPGLELVPDEAPPIEVKIVQADDTQPWFVVAVNKVTVEEFRKIQRSIDALRPAGGVRAGSKAQAKLDQEFRERYVKKAISGWSGLTIPNFNAIKSANVKIGGDKEAALTKQAWEMPFSVEAAAWLLEHSWSEDFDAPIFAALKRGAEEQEAEDEGNANA